MLRLKEVRKAAKMSQVELSQKLGVTQATLSGWENEKFEIDNSSLMKCSEIFNVTTDYLLGRDISPVNTDSSVTSEINPRMTLLARHLEEIPEEQREKLIRTFLETVDNFLDAINNNKEA